MKPESASRTELMAAYRQALRWHDPEGAHHLLDCLKDARLKELDPDFLKEIEALYGKMPRWYA